MTVPADDAGAATPAEPIWHVTRDGIPADPALEGFVHASFTSQLAETLRVHYPDATTVTLLRLDPERLGTRLVLEPSRGGQIFPHVYGVIEDADVLARVTLERGPDAAFDLGPLADAS